MGLEMREQGSGCHSILLLPAHVTHGWVVGSCLQMKLRTDILAGGGVEIGCLGLSAQTKMLCRNPPHICKFQNILVQNIFL